jgi:hypothetical protein
MFTHVGDFTIKICFRILTQLIKNIKIVKSNFMVGVQIPELSLIYVNYDDFVILFIMYNFFY